MTTETIDRPEVADEVVDVAEVRDGMPLVSYSATEAALSRLRMTHAGVRFDLTTTAGDKAARAARMELVTLRTTLERKRKAFKEPALAFGKMIDAEAQRITDEILKIEKPIDAQIKADETRREEERRAAAAAEAERKAKLQAGVDGIAAFVRQASAPGMTAARLAKGIEILTGMAFPPEQWQEYTAAAVKAHAEALAAIKEAHAGAVEREAEAARLEAQRIENERVAAELQAKIEALRKQQEEAARRAAAEAAEHAELERERIADLTAGAPKRDEGGDFDEIATQPAAPVPVSQEVVGENHLQSQQVENEQPSDATVQTRAAEAVSDQPLKLPADDVLTASEPATLKGGDIAARLGFTLQAAFIAEVLGIPWRATEKAAKLWAEADFPRIKAALIKHVEAAK